MKAKEIRSVRSVSRSESIGYGSEGQREYGTHHLPCCHAHSFDRKLSSAHIEEVLQTWSEQVNDEDVMETFLAKVVYLRNAGCGPDERDSSQRMHDERELCD